MTTVSGASRYLTSATLANNSGLSPSIPLLTGGGSTQSILDAAKATGSVRGIGLSSSARSLNSQFLSNTGSQGVALLGLTSGSSLSVENLATQIKGLRASIPASQISPEVLEAERLQDEKNAEAEKIAIQKEAESLVKNQRGVSQKEYQERLDEQIRILTEKKANETKVKTTFRRGVSAAETADQQRRAQEAVDRYNAEAKKKKSSSSTVDQQA